MDQPRPRSQPFLYMLGFAVAGPLVGYVLLGLSMGFEGLIGLLIASLFVLPIFAAYLMGAVPAALTGLVAGWSLRWRRPWLYLLVATVSGAAFTVMWNLVLTRHTGAASGYWMAALLGSGSGLICALAGLKASGLSHQAFGFAKNWRAGNVLLAALVAIMAVMVVTLLLPAFKGV